MEKYHGDALRHSVTVLFESKTLYEMLVISVSALVNFLPVNGIESIIETH